MSEKNAWQKFKDRLKWLDPFTYVDLYLMPKLNPSGNKITEWIVYIASAFVFALIFYSAAGFLLGTTTPLVVVVSGSMEPNLYRGDVILLQGVSGEQLKAPEIQLNYPTLKGIPVNSFAESFCSGSLSQDLIACDSYKQAYIQGKAGLEDFRVEKIFFDEKNILGVKKEGDIVVYNSDRGIPVIHRAIAKLKAQDGFYILTKGDSVKNPLIDQDTSLSLYPVQVKELQGKSIFRIPLIGYVKLILFDDLSVLLFGCPYEQGCILP